MSVFTDANEVVGAAGADMAGVNEASVAANGVNAAGSLQPLGTMGFALIYSQQACS